MRTTFVLLLAASILGAVHVNALSTVTTGYVIVQATWNSDNKCTLTSGGLNTLQYSPVGQCIQTGPSTAIMYSSDTSGNIYIDTWSSSATCTGTATTATVKQTTATCVGSFTSYASSYVYSAAVPALTPGSYTSTATYAGPAVTGCTGTSPTSVSIKMNWAVGSYSTGCYAYSCLQSGSSSDGTSPNAYTVTSCVAAAASAQLTGYALFQMYPNSLCAPSSSVTALNQFQLGACTQAGVGSVTFSGQIVGTKIIAYNVGTYVIVEFQSYTTTNCAAGSISLTYNNPVAASDAPSFSPSTSGGCQSNVQYGYFIAVVSSTSQALTDFGNVVVAANSYYATPLACKAASGTPPWTQYQLVSNSSCAAIAPTLTYSPNTQTSSPQYLSSNTASCAATLPSKTGGWAMVKTYADYRCSASVASPMPVDVYYYQLNVCAHTASGSLMVTNSTTTFTMNAYTTPDCTGTATAVWSNSGYCSAPPNPSFVYQISQYQVVTYASAAASAGGGGLFLQYTTQAACKTGSTAGVYQVTGGSLGCGPYYSAGQGNAYYLTNMYTSTSINLCGAPTPTPVGPPSLAPSLAPSAAPTATPAPTTGITVLTATQVVTGVTLATAQTTAFQTAFAAAVAKAAGVSVSAITNIQAAASSRRHLLQTKVTMTYSVAVASNAASAVTSVLQTSGAAVTTSLAGSYTGIAVANPTVQTAAKSGATRGAAAALTLTLAAVAAAVVSVAVASLSL